MKTLALLVTLALAACAAGAEPAPRFAASVTLLEGLPGTVTAAARTGPVVFALRAAIPPDSIFPAAAARPLVARVAFWPAGAHVRRAGKAHQLGAVEVEQTVAIQGAGEHFACIVIDDATGRIVAESTPTKFHF